MIWLRHELWEYTDGLGYRLASRSDTDDTGAPLRGGTLKQIFYAPSPAAAKAQYWALRQLGPIIPSRFESDAPFTLAQLQAQLAQYPDDATLHGQPALHPGEETEAPVAAPLAAAPAEGEPLESLEPWPVVAHSEPDLADAPESVVAEAGADAAEAADEEEERPSNVVPIRPDVAQAPARPESPTEPQSAEAVVMERPRVAASGAMALALAELGPAAASSGALALALAELEPTPHTRPDDGDTGAGGSLALVASHSPSTVDEPPAAAPHVVETADATETVQAPEPAEPTFLEPAAVEPVAVEPAAAAESVTVEPIAVEPLAATAEVAEPLLPEPVAAEKAVEPDPLGPITAVAAAGARSRRKKTGFFGALLRLLILAIVAGAIIIGVGLATGRMDGPTLLAQARALPEQARALPDQIRNLSIVKTLLPG